MAAVKITDFRQIFKTWLTNLIHVNKKVFSKYFMSYVRVRKVRNLQNKPKNLKHN